MAQAGGQSQTEERLCEAAAILRISRRRKAMYGGFFSETKIMSVPGVELVGEQHRGKALTSEPLRRPAPSPRGRSQLGRQGGRSRREERQRVVAARKRRVLFNSGRPRPARSGYGDMPPPPLRHPLPRRAFIILGFLERGPG